MQTKNNIEKLACDKSENYGLKLNLSSPNPRKLLFIGAIVSHYFYFSVPLLLIQFL